MSVVSPLNRVLGLGSAKDGVEHWWAQRLTAVALLPLGLWLVAASVGLNDFGHASVVEWMQAPMNSVLLLLTVLTLTYHSALGVQMVIEDYVSPEEIGRAFEESGLAERVYRGPGGPRWPSLR